MDDELRKVAFLSKKGEKEAVDLKLCFKEIYNQCKKCKKESSIELFKAIMNVNLAVGKITMTLSDISLDFDDYKKNKE